MEQDNVLVTAFSQEDVVSSGASISGPVDSQLRGRRRRRCSIYDITTKAYIAGKSQDADGNWFDGTTVAARGSVLVSALESNELDIGAGCLACGKEMGIGGADRHPHLYQDHRSLYRKWCDS